MQNYKGILQKFTLAVLSLALFAGCIKPQKKSAADLESEGADNNATFYAKEITGKALAGTVGTSWNVPVSTSFNLQVCLSSKRTQDDIRLNKFVISGGEKDIHVRSDNTGCVNWTEAVPFTLLGQPTYITLTRTLRSEGLQTGQRVLKIAVNPWASLSGFANEAVIDLTKKALPEGQLLDGVAAEEALKGLSRDGHSAKRPLNVEPLNITTVSLGAGARSVKTQVTFGVSVKTPVTSGTQPLFSLSSGKALIEIKWLMVNGDKKTVLAQAQTAHAVSMNDNNQFSVAFPLQIKLPSTVGNLEFAMKVVPVDAPDNLGSYEGVFALGDTTALIGSYSPKAESNLSNSDAQSFSIGTYVEGAERVGSDAIEAYKVDHLSVKNVHYIADGTNQSTIGLTLRSCIHDSARPSLVLQGLPVNVTNTSGKSISLKTDELGCFSWGESFVRDSFSNASLYKTVSVGTGTDFKAQIHVRIDPVLMATNPSGILTDLRDLGDSTPVKAEGGAGGDASLSGAIGTAGAQIILKGYIASQPNRYYQADSHLQLSAEQTITLTLEPKIKMPGSAMTGSSVDQPLHDGPYLLRAAIRLPSLGPAVVEDIGLAKPQIVIAQGGVLHPTLVFKVSDFREFGSLSQLYIEISPVDEAKAPSGRSSEQILARYPTPESLKPQGRVWAPRLFVASYFSGQQVVRSDVYAVDELLHCQGVDCAGASQLSIVGKQVMNANFISEGRDYASFTQIIARANQLGAQRTKRVTALESTQRMLNDLNAYGFDLSSPQKKAFVQETHLDKVDVDGMVHRKLYSAESINTLCDFWASHVMIQTLKDLGLSASGYSPAIFSQTCRSIFGDKVHLDPLNMTWGYQAHSPFVIDRRLKLIDRTPLQSADDFVQWSVSPGTSFSASYSESFSDSWTMAAQASAGLGGKVGIVEGEAGVSTTLSRSVSDASTVSKTQVLSTAKYLAITRVREKFAVKRYLPCVVITPSTELMTKASRSLGGAFGVMGLGAEPSAKIFAKRLMLCNGAIERPDNNRLLVTENYYIVTEAPNDPSQVSPSDMNSAAWGTVIRGASDYANFLKTIQASPKRSDVDQTLETKADFISSHVSPAMGHPGYVILP